MTKFNRKIEKSKNRKIFFLLAALLAASAARAARSPAFAQDAFNAVVPPATQGTALFAPLAFELDCCIFAEACDPIKRAAVAESLGVLTDFRGVYEPIREALSGAATNNFSYLSAQALCLPSALLSYIEYRRRIQELCDAAVCQNYPTKGAERWLQSKMEGEMEDFEVPLPRSDPSHYRFFDLVSVRAALAPGESVTEETRPVGPDGATRRVLRTRRVVDYCRSERGLVLRLALDGGAELYLLTPAPGRPFAILRDELAGNRLRETFLSVSSVSSADAGRAWADVTLPALDVTDSRDLAPGFVLAKVPTTGFDFLDKSLMVRDARARVRFRLEKPVARIEKKADRMNRIGERLTGFGREERGEQEEALLASPRSTRLNPIATSSQTLERPDAFVSKDLGAVVYDRPFLFFVYHPELDVVSVCGQVVL